MESSVDALFSADLLAAASRAFGADPDRLEKLGDFESYVYGYDRDSSRRVLTLYALIYMKLDEGSPERERYLPNLAALLDRDGPVLDVDFPEV